jgi:lysophospholipid acyltransferase (LPLAT)-like uncharacterized protein
LARSSRRTLTDWLTLNVALPFATVALRLLGLTLRRRRTYHARCSDLESGGHCVFALWHCDVPVMMLEIRRFLPHGSVHIMASRSRDGELAARFVETLGATTARGSSSRGGSTALREMARRMTESDFAAFPVDGPRGPRFEAKIGAVALAAYAGLPVVPCAAHAPGAWRARSWDRTEFPYPFSRVAITYGEPIDVPADADRETLERLRGELERRLREMKASDRHA